MSIVNQVMDAVMFMAQATNPYATIRRGALPASNGISLELAAGGPTSTFMDKSSATALDVVLNGKHKDLGIVSDTLNDIHATLTRALEYPSGDGWQITNIATASAPGMIEREKDEQYLFGSALTVNFYFKG